jgi:Secretion system C-terminal sorting domain
MSDLPSSTLALPTTPAWTITPNPAHTECRIFFEKNTQIRVYSTDGRCIATHLTTDQPLTLHTAHWPDGMYFVQAQDANGRSLGSRTLVVQH